MSEYPIIVAGAGIAGLTCALSLAQRDHHVKILEAFDAPEEVGAGIQVPPNAWRVLDKLGLGNALDREAIKPRSIKLGDAHQGKILLDLPVNRDEKSDNIFSAIHRAHLHGLLWEAAQKNPKINIITGCKVQSVSEKSDGLDVLCETSKGERIEAAKVLIGADGIWSNVRRYVPNALMPSATGRIALRAMVPGHGAEAEPSITAWMAPKSHVVCYPVHNTDTLNVVAIIDGAAHSGSWSQKLAGPLPTDLSHVLAHITPLPSDEVEFLRWPLYSIDPEGAWFSDHICLIGDAAHGMEPFAAQGAAMGIEDAYVLARCLDRSGIENASEAFTAYRKERLERVQRVAQRTEFNRIAYHQSGIGRMVRNSIFKMRKPEDFLNNLDWLYDFDATD